MLVSFASPASFARIYLLDAASFLVFALIVARICDVPAAGAGPGGDSGPGGYRQVFADRLFRRLWLIVLLMITGGYAQYHAAFPVFATAAGGLSARGRPLHNGCDVVPSVFDAPRRTPEGRVADQLELPGEEFPTHG